MNQVFVQKICSKFRIKSECEDNELEARS